MKMCVRIGLKSDRNYGVKMDNSVKNAMQEAMQACLLGTNRPGNTKTGISFSTNAVVRIVGSRAYVF